MSTTRRFSAILLPAPEIRGFTAQCAELDVASQGETVEEALANLREALSLRLEDLGADDLPPEGAAVVAQVDVVIPAA